MTSISCEEHRTKHTLIFTLWFQKFPWKPLFFFLFSPSFLSYLNLQSASEGKSLRLKPLSLCTPDVPARSPPQRYNLGTSLGDCPELLSSSREGKRATAFTTGLQALRMDISPILLLTCIPPEGTALLLSDPRTQERPCLKAFPLRKDRADK